MNRYRNTIITFTAWTNAACYLIGFIVLYSVLLPTYSSELSLHQKVDFLLTKLTFFQCWNAIIYLLFGLSLLILVINLATTLKAQPEINNISKVLGIIWASFVIASGMIAIVGIERVAEHYPNNPEQAVTLWLAVSTIQEAIGGGVELLGGLWLLLVSWQAQCHRHFNLGVNLLGILTGLAGIITLMPYFSFMGAVFGIGQCLWFICIGVMLFKTKHY